MTEVTLSQMLKAREARASLQQSLIDTYKCPLVSFTMNIAGPIKVSVLIKRAFYEGLEALYNKIPKKHILTQHIHISDTGCEAVFAVNMDAEKIKEICVSIEDSHPLGRLFDMDVIGDDKKKYERKILRGCIVCKAPGRSCSAGRLHSVSQLQAATYKIMRQHFLTSDRKKIADLATKSLLKEVYTTPKPGLVDRRNSGSHTDMDIDTFIRSANALTPYFCECVAIGQETADKSFKETFRLLREAGIIAEKTMYQATHGVNTHKGVIYSMGIICGATGRLWTPEIPISNISDILSLCSEIARDSVKSDFASANGSTAGENLYLKHGLTGIRGEVAGRFSSVTNFGLPAYEKALGRGLNSNDAGLFALIHLIANVKDTNLYHRGGLEGAQYAVSCAKAILKKAPHSLLKELERLDDDFIKRNLSPGGCADLLAVTYFIHKLKRG